MGRILVEDVKRGSYEFGDDGGLAVAVKYSCDGATKWIINDSALGMSNFHISDEDVFDRFMNAQEYEDEEMDEFLKMCDETRISEFNGFTFAEESDEIINDLAVENEDESIGLLKFVMHLTVCDDSEADDIIKHGIGKYSDEIYDVECDFSQMTDEQKYRFRLQLEADMEYETVFHDMYHDEFEIHRKTLKKLSAETDDAGYSSWKERFISDELKKINKTDIIACPYVFAGIGQYLEIMHKDSWQSFDHFIMNNGSAIMGESRQATDDEIKMYIALNVGIEE